MSGVRGLAKAAGLGVGERSQWDLRSPNRASRFGNPQGLPKAENGRGGSHRGSKGHEGPGEGGEVGTVVRNLREPAGPGLKLPSRRGTGERVPLSSLAGSGWLAANL